jgi:hypothetical protein
MHGGLGGEQEHPDPAGRHANAAELEQNQAFVVERVLSMKCDSGGTMKYDTVSAAQKQDGGRNLGSDWDLPTILSSGVLTEIAFEQRRPD